MIGSGHSRSPSKTDTSAVPPSQAENEQAPTGDAIEVCAPTPTCREAVGARPLETAVSDSCAALMCWRLQLLNVHPDSCGYAHFSLPELRISG